MSLPVTTLPLQLGYAQALNIAHLCHRPTRINQQSYRPARKRNATVHLKSCPDSGQAFPLSAEPTYITMPQPRMVIVLISRLGNLFRSFESTRAESGEPADLGFDNTRSSSSEIHHRAAPLSVASAKVYSTLSHS